MFDVEKERKNKGNQLRKERIGFNWLLGVKVRKKERKVKWEWMVGRLKVDTRLKIKKIQKKDKT